MNHEKATAAVRLYPTDYKFISEIAKARRTIISQVVREIFSDNEDYQRFIGQHHYEKLATSHADA